MALKIKSGNYITAAMAAVDYAHYKLKQDAQSDAEIDNDHEV